MASKENAVALVDPHQLASVIRSSRLDKVSIIRVTFEKGINDFDKYVWKWETHFLTIFFCE